jgi:uncharacterized protein with NRDE domain
MCTLIAAVHMYPHTPLLLGASRDEALGRPALPPFLWEGEVAFLAPRDEQARGTWLGLNAHGLFVGVTNRFPASRHPERTSRGTLVLEALAARSAATLHARLEGLCVTRFNPFHLFYADRHSAHLTWSDGERVHQADLSPGLHVLTERSLQGPPPEREAWVKSHWSAGDATAAQETLHALLATHAPQDVLPVSRPCVHVPALDYGTRSAMVLRLGTGWEDSRLLWAEGPPCTHSFADISALMRRLPSPSSGT